MHFKAVLEKLNKKVKDFENLNRALYEANEELRDFVHIVSHDFQEPLRKLLFLAIF